MVKIPMGKIPKTGAVVRELATFSLMRRTQGVAQVNPCQTVLHCIQLYAKVFSVDLDVAF